MNSTLSHSTIAAALGVLAAFQSAAQAADAALPPQAQTNQFQDGRAGFVVSDIGYTASYSTKLFNCQLQTSKINMIGPRNLAILHFRHQLPAASLP